jgi:DtxR family Mn-dependent transcriptional regulator
MPSLTVENYLKSILLLEMQSARDSVSTGQISSALSVSPGTVTSMLKTLADSNLVSYTPYEGVRLTESGRSLATRVLRRHRLLELFLVNTLEMSWDEVHEEAEHMEHAVSDRLVDKIEQYLGHPKFDPHGDPIPQTDGTFARRDTTTLADCAPTAHFRVVRVVNQEPAFLRYLSETGLELDTEGTVVENRPEAGIVALDVDNRRLMLARASADKILVTVHSDK